MININFKNIEELLFKNSEVKTLLLDLRHIFDQWLLSYRFPALNTMRKQAIIDLLNSLDSNHIEKLARLLGDMVHIEKLDYHIIKNFHFSIDDAIERALTNYDSYSNLAIARNADQIYVTIWR